MLPHKDEERTLNGSTYYINIFNSAAGRVAGYLDGAWHEVFHRAGAVAVGDTEGVEHRISNRRRTNIKSVWRGVLLFPNSYALGCPHFRAGHRMAITGLLFV